MARPSDSVPVAPKVMIISMVCFNVPISYTALTLVCSGPLKAKSGMNGSQTPV